MRLLLLLLLVCATYGQDCVYSPGEYITKVPSEYGCGTLDCRNITTNYTEYTFDGWILPDVTSINATYSDNKFVVNEDDWTITVYNITRQDTGLYHCMLIYEGQYYLVRMGLNAKGPFFIDTWEEYQDNTVIGLVAMGSFLVLSLVTWLLWKYRYVTDDADSVFGDKVDVIDGFGAVPYSKATPADGDVKVAMGHPRVPSYIQSQESIEELPMSGLDVTEKALRKRSPDMKPKVDPDVVVVAGGVENPAFVRESSVVSDKIVDTFFEGSSADEKPVALQVTEL